jgi:serine/threonine protein kinase
MDITNQILNQRYHVQEFIGRGGMASVYKVWDDKRTTHLALKLLHDDLAEDPIFIRRFRREADNLKKLGHPNIVRYYGLEQNGPHVFMLMEYIDGSSLRTEIASSKGRPFSSQRIKEVMTSVCSAVHFAHQMHRVHCDLKPANILIESTGRLVVADFGIARMADGATTMTMVGAGTPAYMAPEQVRGEDPTTQTDIYALGIILYEMLSGGERPFTGDRATITGTTGDKVRWEHVHLEPLPLTNCDPDLQLVVMRCLAKNPDERYSSALELLNALSQILAQKVDKRLVEYPENDQPRTRTRPIWLYLGLPILIMGIAVGVLLLKPEPNLPAPPNSSTSIVKTTEIVRGSTPTAQSQEQSPHTQTIIPTKRPSATMTSSPTLVSKPQDGDKLINLTDNATMIYITGGVFWRGVNDQMISDLLEICTRCEKRNFSDGMPLQQIEVQPMWIYQTEVTNAQYKSCVRNGACSPPHQNGSRTHSNYYTSDTFSDYPVVNVNWNDASSYCNWVGGRLPTEAEWEKAARGTDQRLYPWSNYFKLGADANAGGTLKDTVSTGSYMSGQSPYGVLDLSGNVYEWISDWYKNDYYVVADSANPTGPVTGEKRVIRGGSFDYREGFASTVFRDFFEPSSSSDNIGFRCVVTP